MLRRVDVALLGPIVPPMLRKGFKTWATLSRFLSKGTRFLVTAERLEDRRSLAISRLCIEREPLGTVKIASASAKRWKSARISRTRQTVPLDRMARHATSCSAICSARSYSAMQPTISPRSVSSSTSAARLLSVSSPSWHRVLQTFDLRLEIEERNDPVRGRRPDDTRRLCHIPARQPHHDTTPEGGLGGAIYGNDLLDHWIGASTPSLMRGPTAGVDVQRQDEIDDVLVEPSSPAGRMRAPL